MHLTSKLIALLISYCLTTAAHAIQNPVEKIHITADSWNYNRHTGISTFLGPVKIDQGTAHIEAAKVVTQQTDDKHIKEMTAYGNAEAQAHYWKNSNDSSLHAYAGIIHYVPEKALITLTDNAHIQQGNNHFKGHLIYYNMKDQTINAPKTPNSRTTIIYQPN